jgi:xylulokinase
MFLGIDLGTSSIKVVLLDHNEKLLDSISVPLTVQHPQPGFSEQNPQAWWQALEQAMYQLRDRQPSALRQLLAIGFSGQMHGATLLDEYGDVLRPCILWNDGRSAAECRWLEQQADFVGITGNRVMAGFTAPKLLWVQHHEPDIFARVARVLLPKDYLRYRMSGDFASDMSDSAGTLWLDTARRAWSDELLVACNLTTSQMPELYEGNQITGTIYDALADAWGLPRNTPLVAGAGDNAASAVGLGVIKAGDGFVSLGTSGVIFVAADQHYANPQQAVHSFCHALPNRWHQMAVTLSAAASLSWFSTLTSTPEAQLAKEAEQHEADDVLFAPYLSGERTPWNAPQVRGAFFGLASNSQRGNLARAVLEGVAFSLTDGYRALQQAGCAPHQMIATGGGARSQFWLQMIADLTQCRIIVPTYADVGAAFGAARLARLAIEPEALLHLTSHAVPATAIIRPQSQPELQARYQRYQQLTRWLCQQEG